MFEWEYCNKSMSKVILRMYSLITFIHFLSRQITDKYISSQHEGTSTIPSEPALDKDTKERASPVLTCCTVLKTSFGGKGPHLRRCPFFGRSSSLGFRGFSSALRQMPGDLYTVPGIISLSSLSLATYVTDVALGASGLWLGARTVAAGTATLAWSSFFHCVWLHERQRKSSRHQAKSD